MAHFNRNIIIERDITTLVDPHQPTPRTLDAAPPAGTIPLGPAPTPAGAAGAPPATGAAATTGAGTVATPTADDYLTRLLKYVPMEVVGAYLLIAGLISSNVEDGDDLRAWLLGLLLATLVLTALYVVRVLGVVRLGQAAMSVVGITTYAFAMGGWFGTLDWYEPWHGTVALVVFGVLVRVIRLAPLPTD